MKHCRSPVAARIPHLLRRHDQEVRDCYHWVRDRSDPRVREHLRAENAYTEQALSHLAAARKRVYGEMLGRIQETDRSVPEALGGYLYYSRTEKGKPYRIHGRKSGDERAAEQVLLDENELARGKPYFRCGALRVSPGHGLLAYSTDEDGSEHFTVVVKDLASDELLPDVIGPASYGLEWSNDERVLFYTARDEAHRPYRLMRHVLGRDAREDEIVYQEDDEAFHLGLYKTKDRRYLMLSLESNTTGEIWFLSADDPLGEFRRIEPRRHRVEYGVEHHDGHWLILTNEDAVNSRLCRARVGATSRGEWQEVLAHDPDVKLDDLEIFRGHAAVFERRGGVSGIRILTLPDAAAHVVELPETVRVVHASRNPDFESRTLRFVYSSLVTPESVFDYDMDSRRLVLRKETQVVGGYDRTAYVCERRVARAADGAEIPISLVYRADDPLDARPRATILYGYGAYGICVEPMFDSRRLSLLDRGVVYAIAHVRGGGELGRPWYDAGKLEHKRNSFTDFVACAERLIESGITSPDRLAIRGGSAGGLLVGAAVNLRPELFCAVVARVPFVDVVNTLCDESLPLTVTEWEEWGDPRRREDYERIRSYSPYDNVTDLDYPHMLVTGGWNDPRVAYWEPAKWVARLRERGSGSRPILLKMDLDAGHGGPSGRYASLEDLALEYTFLLDRLGVAGPR